MVRKIRCEYCGAKNSPKSKYCTECGKELIQKIELYAVKRQFRHKRTIAIIAVALIMLGAGSAGVLYKYQSNKAYMESSSKEVSDYLALVSQNEQSSSLANVTSSKNGIPSFYLDTWKNEHDQLNTEENNFIDSAFGGVQYENMYVKSGAWAFELDQMKTSLGNMLDDYNTILNSGNVVPKDIKTQTEYCNNDFVLIVEKYNKQADDYNKWAKANNGEYALLIDHYSAYEYPEKDLDGNGKYDSKEVICK